MNPCCAVKVGLPKARESEKMWPGDLNVVCTLGPLSNAWYGVGEELSAEAVRDENEEELISFPQRLHSDPIGASASLRLKRPLVSHFLSNFCKMVWPKLSGVVQKLMDERVQEALMVAIQQLPESMRKEVHYNISFGDSAPSIQDVYSWRQHPCVKDGIEVCGKMHWDASVDMQLTLGPLKFGINRILIDGGPASLAAYMQRLSNICIHALSR